MTTKFYNLTALVLLRFIYLKCLIHAHIHKYIKTAICILRKKLGTPNKVYILLYTCEICCPSKIQNIKDRKAMSTYRFCYWFIIKILFRMKRTLSWELALGISVLYCHLLWHCKGQIQPRCR